MSSGSEVLVPEGWERANLGKYIKLQGGNAFKSSDFVAYGIPVLRISNIKVDGCIDLSGCVYHRESDSFTSFLVKENDILIAMSGATTGKTGKYSAKTPAYLNQRVGRFLAKNKNVSTGFIYQLVKSEKFSQKLLIDAIGGAQPNISGSQIESSKYTFPPLPEQKKIASILTSVDDVIEKTEAQISKLQDLKKGMMTELLTKGIGHTEFKDSPVGRIPVSWEVKTVKEVVENIKSGLSRRIVSQDIGLPMMISGNIQDNKLDTSELKYWHKDDPQGANTDNYMLQDGDILMCFINSISQIGKCCIYEDIGRPTIYTTNMFRIQAKEGFSSDFLYQVFITKRFQDEIQLITKPAVNQASFTKADLEKLWIPIPPVEERNTIVSSVRSIDTNIESKQQKLSQTKALKKALMNDLLTGKVRVKTTTTTN